MFQLVGPPFSPILANKCIKDLRASCSLAVWNGTFHPRTSSLASFSTGAGLPVYFSRHYCWWDFLGPLVSPSRRLCDSLAKAATLLWLGPSDHRIEHISCSITLAFQQITAHRYIPSQNQLTVLLYPFLTSPSLHPPMFCCLCSLVCSWMLNNRAARPSSDSRSFIHILISHMDEGADDGLPNLPLELPVETNSSFCPISWW